MHNMLKFQIQSYENVLSLPLVQTIILFDMLAVRIMHSLNDYLK